MEVLWLAFFFGLVVYVPIALWQKRKVRIARSKWRPPKAQDRMSLAEADMLVDQWKAETGYKYEK